jgi:hypothetical protein
MIHLWAQATDSTGAAVRVVLFDYKKAFDLIDHQILVQKILSLNIPRSIARWVADFLTNRKQRVKLFHMTAFPNGEMYLQESRKAPN